MNNKLDADDMLFKKDLMQLDKNELVEVAMEERYHRKTNSSGINGFLLFMLFLIIIIGVLLFRIDNLQPKLDQCNYALNILKSTIIK
jgi:hypothetical protein